MILNRVQRRLDLAAAVVALRQPRLVHFAGVADLGRYLTEVDHVVTSRFWADLPSYAPFARSVTSPDCHQTRGNDAPACQAFTLPTLVDGRVGHPRPGSYGDHLSCSLLVWHACTTVARALLAVNDVVVAGLISLPQVMHRHGHLPWSRGRESGARAAGDHPARSFLGPVPHLSKITRRKVRWEGFVRGHRGEHRMKTLS
jgi:hypothetical protein